MNKKNKCSTAKKKVSIEKKEEIKMGRTGEQRKQFEAIFVPNKRTHHIEFAGVEEKKDADCDIHGNPRRNSKRDSITFPISLSESRADSILKKRDSMDREIYRNGNGNGNVDNSSIYGNSSVQRRRSSSDKSDADR